MSSCLAPDRIVYHALVFFLFERLPPLPLSFFSFLFHIHFLGGCFHFTWRLFCPSSLSIPSSFWLCCLAASVALLFSSFSRLRRLSLGPSSPHRLFLTLSLPPSRCCARYHCDLHLSLVLAHDSDLPLCEPAHLALVWFPTGATACCWRHILPPTSPTRQGTLRVLAVAVPYCDQSFTVPPSPVSRPPSPPHSSLQSASS